MKTISQLISEGKHLNQELSFHIDNQKKTARTLCAFANTSGGRLLIGIKDNGKIVGCNPEEELNMIHRASSMFCQPEVPFNTKIWQEDFRLILEIHVPLSENAPHKAKDDDDRWNFYIRLNDHSVLVNKILERVWTEKKKAISKPEKFDDDELIILKLINDLGEATLSKLYRLSNLPLKKVDKILVMLVCWDSIQICFKKNEVHYKSKLDI